MLRTSLALALAATAAIGLTLTSAQAGPPLVQCATCMKFKPPIVQQKPPIIPCKTCFTKLPIGTFPSTPQKPPIWKPHPPIFVGNPPPPPPIVMAPIMTPPVVIGSGPVISRPVTMTSTAVAAPPTRVCLVKEYTQQGAVLFRDLCTNEWAMNPPPAPIVAPPAAPQTYLPPATGIAPTTMAH